MSEHVRAQYRPDGDTADAITVVHQDGSREKTMIGSYEGHHEVAYQKICLGHGHVVLFCRLALDEIEDGGRTLHPEKSSHQTAERTGTHLYLLGGRQFDALAEQHEVDAGQDEHYTKDFSNQLVFHTGEDKDGHRRDDDEGEQYRPKSPPYNKSSQPPYYNSRRGDGQYSRQCGCLTVTGHEKRQHRHDEDAKAKARRSLHETCTDAEQKNV